MYCAPVLSETEGWKIRVQRLGTDEFSVEMAQDVTRALIVAPYVPRRLRAFPKLDLYDRPEAGVEGALMAAVALWPEHEGRRELMFAPDLPEMPGDGLGLPWVEAPGSVVLVPEQTASELALRRNVGAGVLLDPRKLPIPAVGEVLSRAAEAVLGGAHPETLLRVALHWAFACEVCQTPWPENHEILAQHTLSVPQPVRTVLDAAAQPLVVPQIARLTAIEAVCSRHYANAAASYHAAALSILECGLVEGFFPSLLAGHPPSHPEIRSALWLLSQDSPFDSVGGDGPAMLAAGTFGVRSTGAPQDALRHWFELLSLPDGHPHGSWHQGQAPSDLRADLRTAAGIEMRIVAWAVCSMLTHMTFAQNGANQLHTLMSLLAMARHTLRHPDAEPALTFATEHLATTVHQLRETLALDDFPASPDGSHDDAAARRRRVEEHGIEHPFLICDDGTLVPTVSLPDVVHGTIELCQAAHNGQAGTPLQRRQRIGDALGPFFEALVTEKCHSLGAGHWVIGSADINEVMDRVAGTDAKRADVIVGHSDGRYLVIEATRRSLRPGIRYGDPADLNSWADVHLRKLAQATSTADRLWAITAHLGMPTPRSVASLVVGDLPLRQDIGLSLVFAQRSKRQLPPFVCGIIEFEILIEMGQQGCSVPSLVTDWQNNGSFASLGYYLSDHPGS